MKKAWYDNNHEGKLLRYGLNKLAKVLKKAEDVDDIIKIMNAVSVASNSKANIAKQQIIAKEIKELKLMVARVLPQRVDVIELPGA